MKRFLSPTPLLCLLFLLLLSGSASAAGPEISLNGFTVTLDHPAYIKDGVTMVPAEEFLQLWGGPVRCRPKDGEPLPGGMLVRGSGEGGSSLTVSWYDRTLVLTPGAETMTGGGEKTALPRPAQLIDGILYAPLRPVAEALGATVEWTGTVVELTYPPRRVVVDNLLDLFNEVGPDTFIFLSAGAYSLGRLETAKIDNPYVEVSYDVFDPATGEYDTGERWEVTIKNVRDLTIFLADDCRITVPWAYADVLRFENCSRIDLRRGTYVHDVEPGSCTGNCIELENCSDVSLTEVILDGSGAYGVCAYDCQRVTLGSCSIQNCTYGAASLWDSQDVKFLTCRIINCLGCFHMIEVNGAKDIRLWECVFQNCSASALAESYYGTQSVIFDHCLFWNSAFGAPFDYGWQSSGGAVFVDCSVRQDHLDGMTNPSSARFR